MRSIVFRTVLFLSCFFLSACGVKGPLYPAPKNSTISMPSSSLQTVNTTNEQVQYPREA